VSARHAAVAAVCAVTLGLTGAACADSKDDSGAVTKLDDLSPQVAKLRLEVHQLRQEVQSLREEVALLTPATDPDTGLPLVDDTTTTSLPSQ